MTEDSRGCSLTGFWLVWTGLGRNPGCMQMAQQTIIMPGLQARICKAGITSI